MGRKKKIVSDENTQTNIENEKAIVVEKPIVEEIVENEKTEKITESNKKRNVEKSTKQVKKKKLMKSTLANFLY